MNRLFYKDKSHMTAPGMHHHSLVKENEVCYSIGVKEIVTGFPGFEQIIRDGDIIYVDKTEYVHRMLKSKNRFFFISRPRRFGKSLMCATLAALFSGKKELFDNLYISKIDYDFKKYPVIRFDFSKVFDTDYDEFLLKFYYQLLFIAEDYNLELPSAGKPSTLLDILLKQFDNPVIIIDEFDSPIVEAVSSGRKELAEGIRSEFNAFYKVIKNHADGIRFFFMTGCTKLSGLGIFSAMNNLKDISRDAEYSAMFGYTEEELEHYFDEHIDYKVEQTKDTYISRGEFLDALRNYYDGYRFSPKSEVKVYNPVSVGSYFSSSDPSFDNYWMDTGGMSTLAVTLARKADLLTIVEEKPSIGVDDIKYFDITSLSDEYMTSEEALTLLYYAGYLTISSYEDGLVYLDFPNSEVRRTFLRYLVRSYMKNFKSPDVILIKAYTAARKGEYNSIITLLNELYRHFNYADTKGYKEQAVKLIFKTFFSVIGMSVMTEVPAGEGDSDAVLIMPHHNYIFEFKADSQGSEEALAQIAARKYAYLFTGNNKPLHLIGLDFRTETKQIASYTHQLHGSDEVETVSL